MAKLVEETVVINVARMFKDDEGVSDAFTNESLEQLEAIITELVGNDKALIEINKLDK